MGPYFILFLNSAFPGTSISNPRQTSLSLPRLKVPLISTSIFTSSIFSTIIPFLLYLMASLPKIPTHSLSTPSYSKIVCRLLEMLDWYWQTTSQVMLRSLGTVSQAIFCSISSTPPNITICPSSDTVMAWKCTREGQVHLEPGLLHY